MHDRALFFNNYFFLFQQQSLACSLAAREAGLDPAQVLGALAPARRSMVGSLRSSPVETMAGLMVALSEVRDKGWQGRRKGQMLVCRVRLFLLPDGSMREAAAFLFVCMPLRLEGKVKF